MESRQVIGLRRLCTLLLRLLIILPGLGFSAPAAAGSPKIGDPCIDAAPSLDQLKRSRVHIDRDVAIFIIKHTQRACRKIDEWLQDRPVAPSSRQGAALRALKAELEGDVLVPIYGEYPESRGSDLTEAAVKLPRLHCSAGNPGRTRGLAAIDRATAERLRKALEAVESAPVFMPKDILPHCKNGKATDCVQPILDILQEVGFAASPIYAIYPDLWKREVRDLLRRNPMPARTAASDAEFRAAKSAAGPLHLTPAALGFLKSFDDDIRRDGGVCQIVTLTWAKSVTFKAPDEADGKTLPPGISAGGFWCAYVPKDALETVEGLRIAIMGPEAGRFAGKTIDLDKGRLVLEDR